MLSKVEDTLLHLEFPTTNKNLLMPDVPLSILEVHIASDRESCPPWVGPGSGEGAVVIIGSGVSSHVT